MSCLIVNGSPRNKGSNSNVIATWLKRESDDIIHLASNRSYDKYNELLKKHNQLLIIYPLYVDAMPGIVKEFFEYLESKKSLINEKEVMFIIHSGFSEAVHLRVLERYHEVLKDILLLKRVETVITPGSEGIRLMPERMNKKRRVRLQTLVKAFHDSEELDVKVLKKLRGKEKTSKGKMVLFKIVDFLGLMNVYWNKQLKENMAYEKRFDKPYKK
jgi:translation initiation factor 2 beta subunit (eIF-2beta)/eIF-5